MSDASVAWSQAARSLVVAAGSHVTTAKAGLTVGGRQACRGEREQEVMSLKHLLNGHLGGSLDESGPLCWSTSAGTSPMAEIWNATIALASELSLAMKTDI